MTEIVYAIAGAVGTAMVFALANSIRTAHSLPRRVVRLEEISALSVEALDAQTDGLIAIAEAVSGKRCNGNVDEALDLMRGNKRKTREFLAARIARGGR